MTKSRLEKKETQEREQRGREEVGWDYKLSQFAPSNVLPLASLASWRSHNLPNSTTDWRPSVAQMHEHISYSNYHSTLPSHLVMWNAFCPTKVSIVFKSFNSVQKSKVSSKTQGNLLTENHCNFKTHYILPSYSVMEHTFLWTTRGMGAQWGKTEAKQDPNPVGQTRKPTVPCAMSGTLIPKGLDGSAPPTTDFSLLGLFYVT